MITTPVQEALERLGTPEAVLERHGVTVRRGMAQCPFHDDRSPSLSLFTDRNEPRWRCHGCGAGGDSIDLAQALGERVELRPERTEEPKQRAKKIHPKLTAAQRQLARKLAQSETFPFEFAAAKVLARLHWHAAELEVLRNFDHLAAGGNIDRILRLSDALRSYLPERFGIPTNFVYRAEHVDIICEELGR